jgi:hypothetical protein
MDKRIEDIVAKASAEAAAGPSGLPFSGIMFISLLHE